MRIWTSVLLWVDLSSCLKLGSVLWFQLFHNPGHCSPLLGEGTLSILLCSSSMLVMFYTWNPLYSTDLLESCAESRTETGLSHAWNSHGSSQPAKQRRFIIPCSSSGDDLPFQLQFLFFPFASCPLMLKEMAGNTFPPDLCPLSSDSSSDFVKFLPLSNWHQLSFHSYICASCENFHHLLPWLKTTSYFLWTLPVLGLERWLSS